LNHLVDWTTNSTFVLLPERYLVTLKDEPLIQDLATGTVTVSKNFANTPPPPPEVSILLIRNQEDPLNCESQKIVQLAWAIKQGS
jgi:hypothetical protein